MIIMKGLKRPLIRGQQQRSFFYFFISGPSLSFILQTNHSHYLRHTQYCSGNFHFSSRRAFLHAIVVLCLLMFLLLRAKKIEENLEGWVGGRVSTRLERRLRLDVQELIKKSNLRVQISLLQACTIKSTCFQSSLGYFPPCVTG